MSSVDQFSAINCWQCLPSDDASDEDITNWFRWVIASRQSILRREHEITISFDGTSRETRPEEKVAVLEQRVRDEGSADDCFALAYHYMSGRGAEKNYEAGYALLVQSAFSNDIRAITELAVAMFHHHDGTLPCEEANKLIRHAMALVDIKMREQFEMLIGKSVDGDPYDCLIAAKHLLEGVGTERDIERGLLLLNVSASGGNEEAMQMLLDTFSRGTLCEIDWESAARWYRGLENNRLDRNAERKRSDLSWIEQLQERFDDGDDSVDVELAELQVHQEEVAGSEALCKKMWAKRAYDNRDSHAYYVLGVAYREGYGGDKDAVKSVENLRQAASGGHPEANFLLAISLLDDPAQSIDGESVEELFSNASKSDAPLFRLAPPALFLPLEIEIRINSD